MSDKKARLALFSFVIQTHTHTHTHSILYELLPLSPYVQINTVNLPHTSPSVITLAGYVHSGECKATVWCLSVRPSVCLSIPSLCNVNTGIVSLPQQRHCSVVHGLTPLLSGKKTKCCIAVQKCCPLVSSITRSKLNRFE